MHDDLTGLYSRHQLHKELSEWISQADREKPLSLLLFQIHAYPLWQGQISPLASDRLICEAVRVVMEKKPAQATAYRWDHTKIALLLPDCNGTQALLLEREITEASHNHRLPAALAFPGLEFSLISGSATLPPVNLWQLGEVAEKNLALADTFQNGGYGLTREETTALQRVVSALLRQENPYLSFHASLSAFYAQKLARAAGLSLASQTTLAVSAQLQDVALICIGDTGKHPGPLGMEEYNRLKRHPVQAALLAINLGLSQEIQETIYCHHENYDGQGYPRGLKGEEIPFSGRILGMAGCYAALLLPRPYRQAFKPEAAKKEMKLMAGSNFEPSLVEMFLDNIPNWSSEELELGRFPLIG